MDKEKSKLISVINGKLDIFGWFGVYDIPNELEVKINKKGNLSHKIDHFKENKVIVFVYHKEKWNDPIDEYEIPFTDLDNESLLNILSMTNTYIDVVLENDNYSYFKFVQDETEDDEETTFMLVNDKAREIYETNLFTLFVVSPRKSKEIKSQQELNQYLKDGWFIGINVGSPF